MSSLIYQTDIDEHFNGTLRREVLNPQWLATTRQAQIAINQWLGKYNHVRPHEALCVIYLDALNTLECDQTKPSTRKHWQQNRPREPSVK